ncbi:MULTISPECIES: hypothetical protein [unclassified Clostridioides]|uniref:hypothetical protein n=1 Tax=unclassified Clostridioides TaxID=2635829 RepID=UPI001D121D7B|nr:hypothetical protein [Clostridioides sp. ES-S-0171-01]MCC0689921.1 hypothetical protein [Clostridioides sp. ES-S-0056-01]MCC0716591.1 hypothetical protein [Clostridioides sp. ES-S-0077-01]
MKKLSGKYVDIEILSSYCDSMGIKDIIILTNFGFVIGEPDFKNDSTGIHKDLNKLKVDLVNKMKDELQLVNNTNTIALKNVIVKYPNIQLNFNEMILYPEQIVGFFPVDREDYLEQFSLCQD